MNTNIPVEKVAEDAPRRTVPPKCGVCGRFLRKSSGQDWMDNWDGEWLCPLMSYDAYSGGWEHE